MADVSDVANVAVGDVATPVIPDTNAGQVLLIIVIASFLRGNWLAEVDTNEIKYLILEFLLPITVFRALLRLHFDQAMTIFPVVVLVYLSVAYLLYALLLPPLLPRAMRPHVSTLAIMLTSLSPGLSSFAYVGGLSDDALGKYALADITNKVYCIGTVRIVTWACHLARYGPDTVSISAGGRLVQTCGSVLDLVKEPIVIAVGLGTALSLFADGIDSLPHFAAATVELIAPGTTPMLLIYIGLKLDGVHKGMLVVLAMCTLRAGIGLCFVAALHFALPRLGIELSWLDYLGWQLYLQSSCSFWPYATLVKASQHEEKASAGALGPQQTARAESERPPLWDAKMGMSVLIASFPVSVGMLSFLSFSAGSVATIGVRNLVLSHLLVGLSLTFGSLVLAKVLSCSDETAPSLIGRSPFATPTASPTSQRAPAGSSVTAGIGPREARAPLPSSSLSRGRPVSFEDPLSWSPSSERGSPAGLVDWASTQQHVPTAEHRVGDCGAV